MTSEWEITTERFVAFIDIMGFKDMVLKMSHEDIYKLMLSIDKAISINNGLSSIANFVKSTTYSDSIMLYSKDNTDESFKALIGAVSGLTNDLFIEGIPHKGSIAYGCMTLDTMKSIFFGQPLIDAFLLQDELHFYGVIIHGSVEEKVPAGKYTSTFIRKYYCSLKSGKSNHFTVYPMHIDFQSAIDYPKYHQSIKESLEKMKYKTSGRLRCYIDNTEDYFNYISGTKI